MHLHSGELQQVGKVSLGLGPAESPVVVRVVCRENLLDLFQLRRRHLVRLGHQQRRYGLSPTLRGSVLAHFQKNKNKGKQRKTKDERSSFASASSGRASAARTARALASAPRALLGPTLLTAVCAVAARVAVLTLASLHASEKVVLFARVVIATVGDNVVVEAAKGKRLLILVMMTMFLFFVLVVMMTLAAMAISVSRMVVFQSRLSKLAAIVIFPQIVVILLEIADGASLVRAREGAALFLAKILLSRGSCSARLVGRTMMFVRPHRMAVMTILVFLFVCLSRRMKPSKKKKEKKKKKN